MAYDYYDVVLQDAKDYLDDQGEYYDDFEDFMDALWIEDSVTGNGSGSYFFNSAKAREAVSDFIWSEEFNEMVGDFAVDVDHLMQEGPEAVDVTIRCWYLGIVRGDLEDYWHEVKGDEDEE